MKIKVRLKKSDRRPPEMFKPLLWGLKWNALRVEKDEADIILATLNYGELKHLRWIIKTYGKAEIKRILEKRLVSEFHPESRNLAKVLFSFSKFRHARRSTH